MNAVITEHNAKNSVKDIMRNFRIGAETKENTVATLNARITMLYEQGYFMDDEAIAFKNIVQRFNAGNMSADDVVIFLGNVM